jgi:hypothetical protein
MADFEGPPDTWSCAYDLMESEIFIEKIYKPNLRSMLLQFDLGGALSLLNYEIKLNPSQPPIEEPRVNVFLRYSSYVITNQGGPKKDMENNTLFNFLIPNGTLRYSLDFQRY